MYIRYLDESSAVYYDDDFFFLCHNKRADRFLDNDACSIFQIGEITTTKKGKFAVELIRYL